MEENLNKKIILASTSPRRIELLGKVVASFEAVGSEYEEDMTLPMAPEELVKYLSRGKAESLAKHYANAIIIGGDTFIVYDGHVLGKPHTVERAKEMLNMLSGQTHQVLSGFTVIDTSSGKSVSRCVTSEITFKELTDQEIDDYISTGEPLSRAGAYAIQTIGGKFTTKIDGDYDAIVGLPTKELKEELQNLGVETL